MRSSAGVIRLLEGGIETVRVCLAIMMRLLHVRLGINFHDFPGPGQE